MTFFRNKYRVFVSAAILLAVLAATATVVLWTKPTIFHSEDRFLEVAQSPSSSEKIRLDLTVYRPDDVDSSHPAPAVIIAHGFGGSKNSVSTQAEDLVQQGYLVVTYSARGFGRSGGMISLNDPDREIADARRIIDMLAHDPAVIQDGNNDPRVAISGNSYGGALALMTAGYDQRVDSVVAGITWNNLYDSLFAQNAEKTADIGVFKKSWAGIFFGFSGGLSQVFSGGSSPKQSSGNPQCGRFAPEICRLYLAGATTGRADAATRALLEKHSPQPVLSRIKAPTLLIQGQTDTLFPLSEAQANYEGINRSGTPVKMVWYSGGHDGSGSAKDESRNQQLSDDWLRYFVKKTGRDPGRNFSYTTAGGISVRDSRPLSLTYQASAYPGLSGAQQAKKITLDGSATSIANPPAGVPSAISSLPGVGGLAALAGGIAVDIPGQNAVFKSEPLAQAVTVVGVPQVRLKIASASGSAVVFVKLYDVGPAGRSVLPHGLVAPVRLSGLAADLRQSSPVTVDLPAIAYRFETGHSLRIVVATSDQSYSSPTPATTYQVALAGGSQDSLILPQVNAAQISGEDQIWKWVLLIIVVLLLMVVTAVAGYLHFRHRRVDRMVDTDNCDTPLVVDSLEKEYKGRGKNRVFAVTDVSFRVERNQVVGLLGPNGAGKTTTLRMLMGLIRPSCGKITVFGHAIIPGAPVLSRLGSFVEGSGFLPHLSGLANLTMYWKATGRPMSDAHLEEALDIADLGKAVHRKVKTYSQGMRQRLAIAQAMLGLPDLLVLDEPTNGLDPPQIRQMRTVLQNYATDGRSVVVSSHLLAEIEQTCTHVVVMNKGAVIAAGTVTDIVGYSSAMTVELSFGSSVEAARKALIDIPGIVVGEVHTTKETNPVIELEVPRQSRALIARNLVLAGLSVERLTATRKLEDVFVSLVEEQGV